jgi:hypothetical protein
MRAVFFAAAVLIASALANKAMDVANPLPPPKSYLSFGHTVPTANNVFTTITQGNLSYTWSNYHFGEFSGWVDIFNFGNSTIDVYESINGTKGSLVLSTFMYLPPGPLVLAMCNGWPPATVLPMSASYTPANSGSCVRLVNLSPDIGTISMTVNGTVVGGNMSFGEFFTCIPIASGTSQFLIYDDDSTNSVVIANETLTPPQTPFDFTIFLIGNDVPGTYSARIVTLKGAPEL